MFFFRGKMTTKAVRFEVFWKKNKVTMVATVDLLMFLSRPLWQEGMLDSWLLPHNITVLYAFACPHCSWFHCVGDLTKKKGKMAKKSGVLSCRHLSCHHISESHHSWVPKQCCQIPGCLWLMLKYKPNWHFGYAPSFSHCTSAQTRHYCIAS